MVKKQRSIFPQNFFNQKRPTGTLSKDPDDKIIPLTWSSDVLNQKKQAIVYSVKKNSIY